MSGRTAGTRPTERGSIRGFLKDNGLGLFFTLAFLLTVVGQVFAGQADFDNQMAADQLQSVGFLAYVTSSDFAVDVAENWQSEYLQFFLYIAVTVWLLQRGSPESKEPGKSGTESDKDQMVGEHAVKTSPKWAAASGWRRTVYANSLLLVMGTIFLLSWLVQSITGVAAYNEQRLRQLQAPMSWADYLGAADFWNRTLQNWQSELLAVASMAVLSIYLRQRGSPESKPVGAAHDATGVEG
jgi:membrane protein implicated in regulation of membrane protease activity